MKVSALVVTNRPMFIPWWTHQIKKQTRPPDEVVVVSNYHDKVYFADKLDVLQRDEDFPITLLGVYREATLGELRQAALDAATGDVILWFDDDDWYHPRRIELTVGPIEAGICDVAVLPLTHWYYLKEQLTWFTNNCSPALPATTWRADLAKRVSFKPLKVGEDHFWIHSMLHPLDESAPVVRTRRIRWIDDYASAFGVIVLVHGKNTWQSPMEKLEYIMENRYMAAPLPRFTPKDVTQEEWDKTWQMLSELRVKLGY